MLASLIYGAGNVRVESVPDPKPENSTDAVVRVLRAAICGTDLWAFESLPATDAGAPIGHEFLGVVEDVGSDVAGISAGDVVVAPFVFADNTCEYCVSGLHTSCRSGGAFGMGGVDGGQAEAVRVPQASGTLVKLPVGEDSELLPSLLTLADVFATGHHAAVTAGAGPHTTVTVVGDGAVGVLAVLAARRLGAERIILMGRHPDRTTLGREFGATDVVAERGEEGIARVRELTGGHGSHSVLECVGSRAALDTALGVVRDGGAVSCVGMPKYTEVPAGLEMMFARNVTLTGGLTPARTYIDELLPDVLEGKVEPGRVFDHTVGLRDVPAGYRAMADREALKVLVRP